MFRTTRQSRMLIGLALLILMLVPFVVFAQEADEPTADEPTAQVTVVDMTPTVISTEDAPIVDEPVDDPDDSTELVTSVLQMIGIGFASLATLGVASVVGFTVIVRNWQQNPEMVKAGETVGDALPDPTRQFVNDLARRVEDVARLLVEVSKLVNEMTDGIQASEKPEAVPIAEGGPGSTYVMSLRAGESVEVVPGSPAVIRPATSDQQDTKPIDAIGQTFTPDLDDGDVSDGDIS